MKAAAVLIGWVGGLLGIGVALVIRGGLLGDPLFGLPGQIDMSRFALTVAIVVCGVLGASAVLLHARIGAWLTMAATIAGAVVTGVLWLAPGSFFFIAAVLGFFVPKRPVARPGRTAS